MCVCVCVCVRERERESESERYLETSKMMRRRPELDCSAKERKYFSGLLSIFLVVHMKRQ